MRRSEPDIALTAAFCASLLVHAAIYFVALMMRLNELERELQVPPSFAARAYQPGAAGNIGQGPVPPPLSSLIQPPPTLPPDVADPLGPEDPRRAPTLPPPLPKEEWGEKKGRGIAITSSPGKELLQARKADDDQAFASRDPEGPGPIPDEPSESLVPQGEGGDGRKFVRDALAGKGTEGLPILIFGNPRAIPAPPAREDSHAPGSTAAANSGDDIPRLALEPRGLLPSQPQSPVMPAIPAAADEGPGGAIANALARQILPIWRRDVIAVEGPDENWWPDTVDALTRPPGESTVKGAPQILGDAALAERETSPQVQPATVAMIAPSRITDEMAMRVGELQPEMAPPIVEALTHPPGVMGADGMRHSLPDLAPADAAGGDAVQDAIAQVIPPPQRPEELAQPLERPGEPAIVLVPKGPIGSAGSATGGRPGPPIPAADSAANTGLESDPFATIPSIVFRNGKVEARSGRQVKPIRPKLGEAGRRDLIAQHFPMVLLKVRIDNTGKVIDVTVLQGSGSDAVDMPVYRSLWGWWFEPPTDKRGNPLPDVQLVAIKWM